jgi:hypothetical protein
MLSPEGAAARATSRTFRTPFHDGQRRSVAVLDDAQQNGPFAVLAHDILLHCRGIPDLPDVLQKDGCAIGELDRDVVESLDRRGHRIGEDRVLLLADLGQARRQRQVLGIHRVDDVGRRQALGLQLRRVDIDHDLPVFSAVRSRERDARDRGQLLAQVVVAVVVELLLVEIVGSQAELQDRNARGIVAHDDRGLDAGRQQHAYVVCSRNDLCDGEVDIDVRLKEDLLHGDAVERLRLHVLDAGHARADRILAVGAHALLHFGGAQPRVLPDDVDDRNVDLGEDVDRHDGNRRQPEKQNEHGQPEERVRKSQRKSNQAHGCALISLMFGMMPISTLPRVCEWAGMSSNQGWTMIVQPVGGPPRHWLQAPRT